MARIPLAALTAACALAAPKQASAHLGHAGELAGHSHWVGLAALAGAALVAGLVALKGRRTAEDQPDEDAPAEDAVETEVSR
ncbi:DUF6732 family protein [Polymorphum gilvum]|uniref:Uncharacterized protein n=1 Tax=Polymorphum gilvum (strain LMG 25793 / CGMCC 1.9160 / SL003B-26A1) TaxID=991905 RepID=F2J5E7_POLGS|nr:DUF6732 family protein [Polymorphum gilvum]ADZ72317.1 hypothetical protein SL003B_3897 [Polymorphum gilvum SL003B-26A1]